MPQKLLTINQDTLSWSSIKGLPARLEKAATVTLQHLPKNLRFPVTATLLLTTNASLRRLNHDFRGLDKPTNVLSFPQHEPAALHRQSGKKTLTELGDIAIAYQYMVAEARKDHKILINHVTHLFIHGLLHLFGYDHMNDPDAGRMERLETKIMAALGLPNPYAPAKKMEPKRSRPMVSKRRTTVRPRK
jgi:probable rRNA maturation factor